MLRRSRLLLIAGLLLTVSGAVLPADSIGADSGEGTTPALRDQERRITVGGLHTCAILDTGAVQCWGYNDHGQLGNGTLAATTEPVTVTGISTAVSLAAGSSHTCALLYGGSVECWGLNGSGQIGAKPEVQLESTTPVTVPDLTDATAIAAGAFHTCAIRADGTVACWGMNGDGELGNGTTGFSPTPVAVSGITGANPAVAITAGDFHSCAVLGDGTVRCWGHNGLGQLGDGTQTTSPVPVLVSGIADPNGARAIAAGSQHTCVVLDDDTVRCWGLNFYGQLGNDDHGNDGDGNPKVSTTPVTPDGNPHAVAITAGTYHTCTLRSDGEARCWGNNNRGQLAYLGPLETQLTDQDVPREVQNFGGGTAITAGGFHTCALVGSSMQCWGYNFYGQLGGYRANNPLPVAVTSLSGAIAIAVGDGHACAIVTAPGPTARCWGSNSDGQLGASGIADTTIPVDVQALADVSSITAGNLYTCALESGSQQPSCWGRNSDGQLGNGTTTSTDVPVAVSGLTNATQIAAGGALGGAERGHTCARRADGTAVCWGRNFDGQLGDGSNTDRSTPVVVSGLTGVQTVATGGFHSCAIVSGGAVWCWGDNGEGQLGNDDDPDPDANDFVDSNVPVQVVGVSGATTLALGAYHSCATVGGGKVRCWGRNADGQVGDGTNTTRQASVEVMGIPYLDLGWGTLGAVSVVAGDVHTCARLSNGRVLCWGDNSDGQLGNGGMSDSDTPVGIAVLTPPPSPNVALLEIGAGRRNTCARLVDTTVHCWGDNAFGQLGDGIGPTMRTPVTVTHLGGSLATNAIPSPLDDAITTAPGTPVVADLLANDADADGDALSISFVSDPPHGAVVEVVPEGNVRYTPDGDADEGACDPSSPDYGRDSFDYTVTDGTASVGAHVTVTVTCPNRPPVALDDSTSVAEDASVLVDVLANDSDPDGDPVAVASVTAPASGTAVVEAGKVRYTPIADFCGPDSFGYTASDGSASDTATVAVSVTCGADPPVANPDVANTTENQHVDIDVLANDQDVDPGTSLALVGVAHGAHGFTVDLGGGFVRYQPDLGFCGVDTFTYLVSDGAIVDTGSVTVTVACEPDGPNAVDDSATVSEDSTVLVDVLANDTDPDGDPLTIDSVTAPQHGTAVIEAGKIRYTPAPDFCGVDGFGYIVRDPSLRTDGAVVAPVNVICNQDPPVANDDSASGAEDTPFAIPVLANDTDPDGDLLVIASITDPPRGAAVVGPNGTVTYAPDPDACGSDAFGYTVDDQHGGTDTATVSVSISCVNDPPILAPVTNATTPWGSQVAVSLVGTDVDGDALTYSLVSGPPGAGVAGSQLTWTPTASQIGTHTVVVAVSDPTGAQASRSFQVSVTKRPTALSIGGATSGQYSDAATLSAQLLDAGPGALHGTGVAGAGVTFSLGSATASATTAVDGTSAGGIVISLPAASATVGVSFAGSVAYAASSATQPFLVLPEAVATSFTGSHLTTTTGTSASVVVSARVTEEADGRLGAQLGTVGVAFVRDDGPTLCTAPVTMTSAGTGSAACTASIPVGAHAVIAVPTSAYYAGPRDVAATVVTSAASGVGAGAGRAGGEAFAFQAKPAARKSPASGSAVHVWIEGNDAVVATSSSVGSFTTTCSGGGAKRSCRIDIGPASATVRRISLLDGTVTALAGSWTLSVSATDAAAPAVDTYSVSVGGPIIHQLGSASSQVPISAGTVRAF